MNEFLLVFRSQPQSGAQPSPEEIQAMMKPWQDWMGSLGAQKKLANPGNRLGGEGKVIKPDNMVTNGPYVETKEIISGYITVNAASVEEATEIAKGCPILKMGGCVEVRPIIPM